MVTFVCRILTVGRRAVTCSSIKIAGRVITRFGLSVTQPSRDITVLRRQAGLPTAHSCQLVCPGILAVLGCLGAIFGRNPAVINGLSAVIRSLSMPRWLTGAIACRLLTLTRSAVSRRSVEVARRVIARRSLSVPLLGLSVTHVRGKIAVAPFDVPLARLCEGVLALIGPIWVLIWECDAAGPSLRHTSRSWRWLPAK